MERILFVDACLRGAEQSRTHRLCRHFLDAYTARHPEAELLCRDLGADCPPLLTGALAAQRENWLKDQPDHPLLAPAREMADADLILIGAPYWDLSFPAALKVYLEWASMVGITFRYAEDGRQIGLSRARTLIFCTTAGGPMAGQNYGYDYLKGLAAMYGIRDVRCVAAEGLDMWGSDVESILHAAEEQLSALAETL